MTKLLRRFDRWLYECLPVEDNKQIQQMASEIAQMVKEATEESLLNKEKIMNIMDSIMFSIDSGLELTLKKLKLAIRNYCYSFITAVQVITRVHGMSKHALGHEFVRNVSKDVVNCLQCWDEVQNVIAECLEKFQGTEKVNVENCKNQDVSLKLEVENNYINEMGDTQV